MAGRHQQSHEGLSSRLGYSTNYKFSGPLWWLPGQGDHQRLSDDCREIFAGLVVEWLSDAPTEVFKVDLRRASTSPMTIASGRLLSEHFSEAPSGCRLMTPPGAALSGVYFRPSHVWVSGAANDRFPFYLRQVAVSVSKIIERRQPEALKET